MCDNCRLKTIGLPQLIIISPNQSSTLDIRFFVLHNVKFLPAEFNYFVVILSMHLYFLFSSERVAVKIIEKTGMDQKALKMLSREITNMDTVRHPAIVRYLGIFSQ